MWPARPPMLSATPFSSTHRNRSGCLQGEGDRIAGLGDERMQAPPGRVAGLVRLTRRAVPRARHRQPALHRPYCGGPAERLERLVPVGSAAGTVRQPPQAQCLEQTELRVPAVRVADEGAGDAGEGEEVLCLAFVAAVASTAARQPGRGPFDGRTAAGHGHAPG